MQRYSKNADGLMFGNPNGSWVVAEEAEARVRELEAGRTELNNELDRLRDDTRRGLKIGHEMTLDTQSVEEMASALVGLVRKARAERDKAIAAVADAAGTRELLRRCEQYVAGEKVEGDLWADLKKALASAQPAAPAPFPPRSLSHDDFLTCAEFVVPALTEDQKARLRGLLGFVAALPTNTPAGQAGEAPTLLTCGFCGQKHREPNACMVAVLDAARLATAVELLPLLPQTIIARKGVESDERAARALERLGLIKLYSDNISTRTYHRKSNPSPQLMQLTECPGESGSTCYGCKFCDPSKAGR